MDFTWGCGHCLEAEILVETTTAPKKVGRLEAGLQLSMRPRNRIKPARGLASSPSHACMSKAAKPTTSPAMDEEAAGLESLDSD